MDITQDIQGVEMALHIPNFWEIALDAAQICLAVLILLFLILNRIRFKQLILKSPSNEHSQNFNTEFVVEAVRQQTELAFKHIIETIDKERQTLDAYFNLRDMQIAPGLLTSLPAGPPDPVSSAASAEPQAASAIYLEIENLAAQGLSLADISERLNVPQGEVDLVLKLKHLSAESAQTKIPPTI